VIAKISSSLCAVYTFSHYYSPVVLSLSLGAEHEFLLGQQAQPVLFNKLHTIHRFEFEKLSLLLLRGRERREYVSVELIKFNAFSLFFDSERGFPKHAPLHYRARTSQKKLFHTVIASELMHDAIMKID